jgi:hypothetical protein
MLKKKLNNFPPKTLVQNLKTIHIVSIVVHDILELPNISEDIVNSCYEFKIIVVWFKLMLNYVRC